MLNKIKLVVIGIGYVGLPLAISLSKYFKVIGFDINSRRVDELRRGFDETREFSKKKIINQDNLNFTSKESDIKDADFFFITVPTPINKYKKPDLSYLIRATEIVAKKIKKNSIVVYESTVYPGCTEEICLPILEKISGLKVDRDFFLAYSPERINPGKSKYKLKNTIKVIGSSSQKTLIILKNIYKKICLGVHLVNQIKIAEAAKIIENTQRDLNVALINELSIIFKRMNLDVNEVLKAAATKWNFIKFEPGLVGGHCIGVDPYYLTYKSKQMGYSPKIILAGRKINDSMSNYVAKKVLIKLKNKNKNKILVLGASFKENCSDLRNSKIFETINFLEKKKNSVYIYDPLISVNLLKKFAKNVLIKLNKKNFYDVCIISAKHDEFKKIGINKIRKNLKKGGLIFDLRSTFQSNKVDWKF